jgi:hypothetical protein
MDRDATAVLEISRSPNYKSSVSPDDSTNKSVASGVNIGRMVKEYGPVEIDELNSRIEKTKQLLEDLEMERDFLTQLVAIERQYRQHKKRNHRLT